MEADSGIQYLVKFAPEEEDSPMVVLMSPFAILVFAILGAAIATRLLLCTQ